ncbi:hypothetical protein AMS68_006944 [Peltaster fructicola]|uniref:mRNA cap guanine-N(7) methyltransferase n=1 Tax=Peltaster fructicola TaxID=286661 RepID=A0A6H0Y348_9PEZI|nr:hypothetical protein AMS68_006944 [Peltaster fructicola]
MATGDNAPSTDARASAKRKRETAASRASKVARTSNTPNAYARRSPPREPSRSRSRSRSPPRKLKRPGARATADRVAADILQRQREDAARAEVAANRQVTAAELVAEHYNAVPQRGREWRSTESQIKGLRSVNNWIKSTLIQKFSRPENMPRNGELLVLDMACGGDLGKFQKAPIVPRLYVGLDIADVSVQQARQRYEDDQRQRQRRGHRGGPQMEAQFHVLDAFGRSLAEIPIVRQVGFDPNTGPGGVIQGGMGGGGFDVVSMMFALHYSFESETLARGMLRNVSGALKKGGRFIGVMPNSNVISSTLKRLLAAEGCTTPSSNTQTPAQGASEHKAEPAKDDDAEEGEWNPEESSEAPLTNGAEDDEDDWDPEKPSEPVPVEAAAPSTAVAKPDDPSVVAALTESAAPPIQWGNSLYSVRFARTQTAVEIKPRSLPRDGIFRPAFGWRYHYSLQEAVDAPEFVVPFEALRALAEEYGLELMYRKGFREVFDEERDDPELGRLAERMGVLSRDRAEGNGGCLVTEQEWEAAAFYHAFVFYKV